MNLNLRPADECRYDAVSLGEIMLRLDPGEGRIRTAREFRACLPPSCHARAGEIE